MTRTDWCGGLRRVPERAFRGDISAGAAISSVLGAIEASDRLAETSIGGRDSWPHPNTLNAMSRHGLTEAEMPEFRRLKDMGFSATEAASVLVRSRRERRP